MVPEMRWKRSNIFFATLWPKAIADFHSPPPTLLNFLERLLAILITTILAKRLTFIQGRKIPPPSVIAVKKNVSIGTQKPYSRHTKIVLSSTQSLSGHYDACIHPCSKKAQVTCPLLNAVVFRHQKCTPASCHFPGSAPRNMKRVTRVAEWGAVYLEADTSQCGAHISSRSSSNKLCGIEI